MENDVRILILAPRGRDAAVVAQVLSAHGLTHRSCPTLGELVGALGEGAGLVFVTEEALEGAGLPTLTDWLDRQHAWSDLPLIVLATKQPGRRSPQAKATLNRLGNVMLLERPLNAETVVSAARSALRSRLRQYAARQHLEEQARASRENERLFQAKHAASQDAADAREALTLTMLDAERRAREQAEHEGRMKDEFLATLSHELRTPLSAILGWVHLLKRHTAAHPDLQRGVDTIERNARSQARLIEELLDMSRIVAGNVTLDLQPLSPQAALDAVLASLQPSIHDKGIRIDREFTLESVDVAADPQRLQQVVWNLLSNAIKFTPVGGQIVVAVRPESGNAVIAITDSGEGISPEFLPFVFDRFRQADGSTTRKHGGLGLGLAIVRQLVQLHGGTVLAKSSGLGLGATFEVRLPRWVPLATEAQPPAPLHPRADCQASGELLGVRIVIVDDDDDGRDMIERLLSESGAEVRATGSAHEAIAELQRQRPDVFISDIGMPGMDGYALMRHLRALGLDIPGIALTAFARDEERGRALGAGYALHLAKPVEPDKLIASVARLLERREPVPPVRGEQRSAHPR